MAIEVPLFPLGTVLFPHMPLSLHIFEERYKTMMRDCRTGVDHLRHRGDPLRPGDGRQRRPV